MNKKYYISNILFDVQSEIPLDEYESELKFQRPVLSVQTLYNVKVFLTDQIDVPDEKPIKVGDCRIWLNQEELRIYPYREISDHAISSCLSDHLITIKILRDVWNSHMKTFRIWSYIFFERILLKNQALILHSASIIYNGKAILFTAPSETGKTTQTDIWHRNNPDVLDLNGDRTILQKINNRWVACGIPISGTSFRCEQAAVPISAIAIVNRATSDSISKIDIIKKIKLLYGQITVFSAAPEDAGQAMTLIEDLIGQIKIVQLNCTMQDSAYQVLLEEITKN